MHHCLARSQGACRVPAPRLRRDSAPTRALRAWSCSFTRLICSFEMRMMKHEQAAEGRVAAESPRSRGEGSASFARGGGRDGPVRSLTKYTLTTGQCVSV